jgi:phosphoglycerate dehydrogenase-like enzyme
VYYPHRHTAEGEIILTTSRIALQIPAPATAPDRPTLLLAVTADEQALVLDAESRERLAATASVVTGGGVPALAQPAFAAALATAEVLLTSWSSPRVDADLLTAAPRLRLVVHAGGTVKFLMTPEAFARGVRVCSAAEANAVPVAEYTLAAIILGAKRAFTAAARYRRGLRSTDGTHRNLDGISPIGTHRMTVGVVGASRIGRKVVRLLRDVLDADVLIYDPYGAGELTADPRVRLTSLEELLAASEVVSLHAPLTSATRRMLDARGLALMPDGAVLVNTARGGIVDQTALTAELVSGRIDAVLDVTDAEPLPPDSVLFTLPNVFLTPHIAGALGGEVLRLGRLAVEEVERYVAGLPLRYEVLPDQLDRLA